MITGKAVVVVAEDEDNAAAGDDDGDVMEDAFVLVVVALDGSFVINILDVTLLVSQSCPKGCYLIECYYHCECFMQLLLL